MIGQGQGKKKKQQKNVVYTEQFEFILTSWYQSIGGLHQDKC